MRTKRKTSKNGGRKVSKPRSSPRVAEPKAAPGHAGAIILATIAVGAAGALGYFGYQAYKKHKESHSDNLDKELLKIAPIHSTQPLPDSVYTPKIPVDFTPPQTKSAKSKPDSTGADSDFPLKKGSKGDKVRQLQQALIDKYGSGVLPKYGADGDFGTETLNALKKHGLPTSISESTFNVLIQGGGSESADLPTLARKLYDAATVRNFSTVLSLLKKISNKDDYQQVSTAFMGYRLHGVRQTLVNGLLSSFASEEQKQQIRLEFIRMGLHYDGSKWSLSGFDGRAIVTTEAATVWVSPTKSVEVPAMMVLGHEVTQRLDYTMFENNNKYFLVKTQSIKYL